MAYEIVDGNIVIPELDESQKTRIVEVVQFFDDAIPAGQPKGVPENDIQRLTAFPRLELVQALGQLIAAGRLTVDLRGEAVVPFYRVGGA